MTENNPCKENFYKPKELPFERFVRTHNQEIIEYIKKGKDSTQNYDFSDPSKYIGIAWNRTSYWCIVGSTSKTEISEEEVLKCMYKLVCESNKYIGVVDDGIKIKPCSSSTSKHFAQYNSSFHPINRVLEFLRSSNSNNLKSETNGTITKVSRLVSRVTNGSRTTGVVVSGRTSKYSITVGHPSNETISC